jgi:transcriptional regulator with XRE-family HTH domain
MTCVVASGHNGAGALPASGTSGASRFCRGRRSAFPRAFGTLQAKRAISALISLATAPHSTQSRRLRFFDFMATFSELLTKHTLRAGISDSELARTTGVQRQTIFRWKEGLSTRPRYRDDLVRIAARLRLTPAETAELLLAAGFPPDDPTAGATAFESAQHPTDDAELEPVNDEKAGAENMPVAAADQAGATPSAPAFAGDLSLH